MGRTGRWTVAGLVTVAAFAVTTWVSGVFVFMRLLPSPDTRWPVAVTIGAAAAAFTGLWGQSWATQSSVQDSRSVPFEQLASHEQREREARDRLRHYLGRRDRLRRMDETSALALRVHPAMGFPQPPEPTTPLRTETDSRLGRLRRRLLPRLRSGRPSGPQTLDPDVPAFVERDRGPQITSWMRGAREDGGFLVLVGDSSVGKTRLLYETARDVLPDFAVLAPDLGDGGLVNSIAAAAFPLPKLIVWLDELQRFLDGPYLTPGSTSITDTAVRQLLDAPTPVVVLGAMWLEHATELRAREPDPHATELRAREPDPHTTVQRLRYPGAADILENKGLVRQEALTSFSGTEREAAAKLSSHDPRLAKALADRNYNVTEVLAGAPQLVARYEQASEEQQAVLNAAIDARRLGIQAPLTETLLRAAARGYLSTLHPDDTWFPAALTELTRYDRPEDHATAPLIEVFNEEKSKILGYTVADYLLQRLTRQRRSTRLSAVTWQALIDHTRDDHDLGRLALHVDYRLLYRYAEPLYSHLADFGDTYAAHRLAELLVNRNGPAEEIIKAFQTLIRGGSSYQEKIHVNDRTCLLIVRRLDERGRGDVAADVRWAWAEAGDRAAAEDWEETLVKQDRIDQVIQISQTVVAIGQERIVKSWFERLLAQDKIDQAMIVLRAFIDAGGIRTTRFSGDSLDDWLSSNCRTRTERSASLYPGDPSGGHEYVVEGWFDRLAQQGRVGDAMTILRAVADAGGHMSAKTLAALLAKQGNIEELRARADAVERERRAGLDDWFGDGLADLMAEQGNIEELRARASDGSWRAAVHLADLLADRGDIEELRARANGGDEAASNKLADLLADRGDIEELRARANDGDKYAARRLADLLADQGNFAEAITIARALAADDGWLAMNFLCSLLETQGNIEEVISLRRAQADTGDEYAAAEWAKLLIEQDRTDEATRIARVLVQQDPADEAAPVKHYALYGAHEWCLRLAEQGRTDEELTVLRALADAGDRWAAGRSSIRSSP